MIRTRLSTLLTTCRVFSHVDGDDNDFVCPITALQAKSKVYAIWDDDDEVVVRNRSNHQ